NLRTNPWIELNVVDPVSRRGYRFFGRATVHSGDDVYTRAMQLIAADGGGTYPVTAIILIAVESAQPVLSPGYWQLDDENAIRKAFYERRAVAEAAFERHIAERGPQRRP